MFTYHQGDILADPATALVNPVNCVGVMGKGLAKSFRDAYPQNNLSYQRTCRKGLLRPGRILIHSIPETDPVRYIINFPTKDHWRNPSELEYIDRGLAALAQALRTRSITSVAIPALGSGLGGLLWDSVHPLILHHLSNLTDTDVRIYPPRPHNPAPAA